MADERGTHPLTADDYGWIEAFGYAGDPAASWTDEQGGPDLRRAHPQDETTPLTHFARSDVAEVAAWSEGEKDADDWLCLGRLNDGRWFLLSAGCDYTGWDCQASGTTTLAPDKDTLLAFGVTDEQKSRLFGAAA